MKQFINYETMITPGIVKVLSWIGMVVALIVGLLGITVDPLTGIGTAILGPVAVRIYAEILLIIFEIHKTLTQIRDGKSD
jgi:hypothetical protein|tara:strand:- start:275 stop:514 length:240 start_codon:yes stop_codon:yes gene_type:complete